MDSKGANGRVQTEGGEWKWVWDESPVKKYQKPLRPMSKEEWEKDPWNYHRARQEQEQESLGSSSKSEGQKESDPATIRSLLTKVTMQTVRDILLNENKLKVVPSPVKPRYVVLPQPEEEEEVMKPIVEAVVEDKPPMTLKDLMPPIPRSSGLINQKRRPKPPPGWPMEVEPTFADISRMTVEQLEAFQCFYRLGLDYTRELKKYLEEDRELVAERIAQYTARQQSAIFTGIQMGILKPEQFQGHFFTLVDGSASPPITIEEEEAVAKEEPILPKENGDQPPKPKIIEKETVVAGVVAKEEPMPKDNNTPPPPTVQPPMIKEEEEENPSMKKLKENFLQQSPISRPTNGRKAPIPPVGYSGKQASMFSNKDLGTKTFEELKKYFDALNQEIAYEKDLRSFMEEDREALGKIIAEYDERRAKLFDGVRRKCHYIKCV